MKILFVHLSDFHFNGIECANPFQTRKIVDSLKQLYPVNRILIILSGDLTNTGDRNQFEIAKRFVGKLISDIVKLTDYKGHIDILCVPGNHDINHNGNPIAGIKLQNMRKCNLYEKFMKDEIKKLDAFYEFSTINNCFVTDKMFCQIILRIDGYSIEVNLINSAAFSILEEDKGLHYLPQSCINILNSPTGADFVITVMHHSPEWYTDSQKILLEDAIYGKSSIVFFGHEHYSSTRIISSDRSIPTFIQAGGCLCQNDNWSMSEYHIGCFDTGSMKYILYNKKWNIVEKQYENRLRNEYTLIHKPSIEKHIAVSYSFATKLCIDEKHDITNDFRDYYVFPRIHADNQNGVLGKDFIDEESFVSEILINKKIVISGGYNSGKTSLLKYLFFKLNETYSIIYCDVSDIRGRDINRIVKNCFEDIYGDNASDYERYMQISKDKKMIFIDNVDQLSSATLDFVIDQLSDKFEFMVFTTIQILDIDLVERMKNILKASDHISRYKLTAFYSDKRFDLISKIVYIKSEDKNSVSKTTKILSDAIKVQRNFVSFDPDFIIKYVEYFCNNIGDASSNDSNIFSKVFESSLITAIGKYQTNKLSVDKIFIILSKIAHYIHFNKAYPISNIHICEIIETYNRDYGSNVNVLDAVDIMIKSKVLIRTDDENSYRFSNKNYLAFFVAKEVNSRYYATNDESDLQKLLQCACFGINSDVLLFISYITDNIRILRLIITMANEFTKEWDEFQFGSDMPQFLMQDKVHLLDLPSEETKKAEKEAEIEAEKRIECEMKAIEIYDYSEESIDEFFNQVIRACSLLIVIAKCLPSFEHLMPKSDKDSFISLLYRMPNKIFLTWAREVDKDTGEIIRYFKEQAQDCFSRQKRMTDDDILRALQWGAMSLLLDLYNLVVFYSVKDNTFHYLDKYDYFSSQTFSLEHLMMIEKQGNGKEFVDSALKLSENKRSNIFSTMLMRIVHKALVVMDNLDFKQQQRLKAEYFPEIRKQKEIMAQRSNHMDKNNDK